MSRRAVRGLPMSSCSIYPPSQSRQRLHHFRAPLHKAIGVRNERTGFLRIREVRRLIRGGASERSCRKNVGKARSPDPCRGRPDSAVGTSFGSSFHVPHLRTGTARLHGRNRTRHRRGRTGPHGPVAASALAQCQPTPDHCATGRRAAGSSRQIGCRHPSGRRPEDGEAGSGRRSEHHATACSPAASSPACGHVTTPTEGGAALATSAGPR